MSIPAETQPARLRIEWLVLCASLLLLGAVLSAALVRERNLVSARENDRLLVQARVVDENLIRQFEGVSKALTGIRTELEHSGLVAGSPATADRLQMLSDAIPGVRTIAVADQRGVIVASSRSELVGANSSQRDFVTRPRERPDRTALYVSSPFRSPLGPLVIAVGRVLSNAQGEFAGVVVATLNPDYFEVVLRSVLYAPDMRASIVDGEGQVFVTMPANERIMGANLAKPGSMFGRYRQGGQLATVSTGPSVIAGDDRMVALRTLDRADLHIDRPLIVSIGRELSAVYLQWRDQALLSGLFYAAVVIASSLGLYFSQRRRTVLGGLAVEATKQRQQGAERLDLALQSADLGLWDLHVPSGNVVINLRERTLLGFAQDDVLPQGGAWRALIHPDDRTLVDEAILPHLRGEVATYSCEHRMMHKAGHYVWLSCRAMIVERTSTGRPVRIVGTHLDITRRKADDAELAFAAASLRHREEELREVTDSLPALVCRWDVDQRFRFANRAFHDWLGIEPASLIGRSLQEVYGEAAYSSFQHHIEAAMSGRRAVYEREMNTLHGTRHVEATLIPQIGSDGAVRSVYGLMTDLTARHQAELARSRSEERLSLALEASGLALFDWDIRLDRVYHSAQAAAMRGEPAVETTSTSAEWHTFVHQDDLEAMQASISATLTGAVPEYQAEFRVRKTPGGWLWVRARGRVVERDTRGRALRLAGTYADIDTRKVAEDRLRHRAEFDMLTNLPNRASFVERLQQAMASATPSSSMALLFLDIDHFKNVNDSLGHEAGDRLLKIFALRMSECVRQSDTVARLAGDEFTVILEGLRGADDAKSLAGQLVELLGAPIELGGKVYVVTVSIGIAMQRDGESDGDELLRRADAALYEAKRRGRNGFFCEDIETTGGSLGTLSEAPTAVRH